MFDDYQNPGALMAKLMATRQGRQPTQEEIAQHGNTIMDAVNTASGVLGSVGKVPAAMERPIPELAQRIKDAASRSNIKQVASAQDAEASMFKKAAEDAPSFWEKYGVQSKPEGPTSKSMADRIKEKYQQDLRQQAMDERNVGQLDQAKDMQFKLLRKNLGI